MFDDHIGYSDGNAFDNCNRNNNGGHKIKTLITIIIMIAVSFLIINSIALWKFVEFIIKLIEKFLKGINK